MGRMTEAVNRRVPQLRWASAERAQVLRAGDQVVRNSQESGVVPATRRRRDASGPACPAAATRQIAAWSAGLGKKRQHPERVLQCGLARRGGDRRARHRALDRHRLPLHEPQTHGLSTGSASMQGFRYRLSRPLTSSQRYMGVPSNCFLRTKPSTTGWYFLARCWKTTQSVLTAFEVPGQHRRQGVPDPGNRDVLRGHDEVVHRPAGSRPRLLV